MSSAGELPREEHERLHDDLAAYALGSLGEDEAVRLEQHLEDCDSCRIHLRWLRTAVEVLPASVEQRTPPERLRESLLSTVRAEAAAASESAAPTRPGAPRPSLRAALPAVRGWLRPAVGVAAAALLAVGVAGGYLLGDPGSPESAFVDAEPIAPALAADVSATLERRDGTAILHVHRLPRLPGQDVYEIWIRRAGVMRPSTVFVLGRDGTAEAIVSGDLTGADAVLVTREPRGGSRRPTSPPLLEASL